MTATSGLSWIKQHHYSEIVIPLQLLKIFLQQKQATIEKANPTTSKTQPWVPEFQGEKLVQSQTEAMDLKP